MKKCKECQRELLPGEGDKCPSCESATSHKWKKVTEAVAVVSVGVIAIGLKLFSSKNDKS